MKSLRPVLLLYALPAALLTLCPAWHDALLYDRDAVARGELWRLWTGHWVHFSASHLAWNLVVLLGAGVWLEHLRPGWLLLYTLLAAPLISAAFLIVAPAMQTYGGLSGLATGVVTLLALVKITDEPRDRMRWLAVLGLVAAKTMIDAGRETPLFTDLVWPGIRTSGWAHALGAGAALLPFARARSRLQKR